MGAPAWAAFLWDSVAETIVREAPCPVMTVGPRMVANPDWSLKIKEILYATDMTPSSDAALQYAISLATRNQARLIILNVQTQTQDGRTCRREAALRVRTCGAYRDLSRRTWS